MFSLSDAKAPTSTGPLLALLRDFDRNAVVCRKRLSETLQSQPELFYQVALESLRSDVDSRAAQFLVTLLVSHNLLFQVLCDPVLNRDRAIALAKQALRVDPLVDISLARQLADYNTSQAGDGVGTTERLMEILDKISDGKRILPSLMRMLRNNNPYLRSKAVLMIGRVGRSLSWIRRRMEESDARVRANAVEALWGSDTAEARELLDLAVRDGNNRVAGNGLLGLYWIGEASVLAELVKMAGSESPALRRTAAWVMGETGDPRFTEILGRMLADHQSEVRKSSFAAVGQIRVAVTQVAQTRERLVSGSSSRKDARSGQRVVSVAVVAAEGSSCPRVLPVQFVLSENGQTVWSYRVTERPEPDAMTVFFLYPRSLTSAGKPWDQGALRCLGWKRPTDLWCPLPYAPVAEAPSPSDLELPSFIASSSQAARAFQETPKRTDCTGFWTAVHRAVQPGNNAARGKRHMIVLAPDDVGEAPDRGLLAAVHGSRTTIQVVSAVPNPALQDFCQRTQGQFHLLEDGTQIEERISLTYLNLLARYEIRYQSAGTDADKLKIRIHTPTGWGETNLVLP